ncbi:MAG: hypothetical protein J6J24_03245 [Clostridia bacterium]|nr:hypothetical protein [Clostridia bacterium]
MKRTLRLSPSCSEEIESSLLKELMLGYYNLEDQMFDQAMMNFKVVIKFDSQCADAYWGLMLAKCQIASEESLFTQAQSYKHIVQLPEFENALKFAQGNQRKQYEGLIAPIRKLIAKEDN